MQACEQFAVPPAPLCTMLFGSRQFDVPTVAVGGVLQIAPWLTVLRSAAMTASQLVAMAMMGHT
jgi:hypothetical protein